MNSGVKSVIGNNFFRSTPKLGAKPTLEFYDFDNKCEIHIPRINFALYNSSVVYSPHRLSKMLPLLDNLLLPCIALIINDYLEVFFDWDLANKITGMLMYFEIRFPFIATDEQSEKMLSDLFNNPSIYYKNTFQFHPFTFDGLANNNLANNNLANNNLANNNLTNKNIDIDNLRDIVTKYPITLPGQWSAVKICWVYETKTKFKRYKNKDGKKNTNNTNNNNINDKNFKDSKDEKIIIKQKSSKPLRLTVKYKKLESILLDLGENIGRDYLTVWDIYHCASAIVRELSYFICERNGGGDEITEQEISDVFGSFRISNVAPLKWYFKNGDKSKAPILKIQITINI